MGEQASKEATLVVANGFVFTGHGFVRSSVVVSGPQVVALVTPGSEPSAPVVIDAEGCYVLPGAIDPHVHFRDPGRTESEDFETGSKGAVLGGVTTVLDMPNTVPASMSATAVRDKLAAVRQKAYCDFGLIGAIDGTNLASVEEMAAEGISAFKVFMYNRRDPPPAGITDPETLGAAFAGAKGVGLPVCVHAEDEEEILANRRAVEQEGRTDWRSFLDSRPVSSEANAIEKALQAAQRLGGVRLHVCHLSSQDGLEKVRRAKGQGQDVTAEVTPQHLLLDAERYEQLGPDMLVVPPIRLNSDRQALWDGLGDGTVDIVATDHAPHCRSAKEGLPLKVATGVVGVQWSLPLVLSAALASPGTVQKVISAMTVNPAKRFGLYPKKGTLQSGSDADIVLVRVGDRRELKSSELVSKSVNSPFIGWTVEVSVSRTILRGAVVAEEGEIVGKPSGNYVRPDI